jgi:hypothetical protein
MIAWWGAEDGLIALFVLNELFIHAFSNKRCRSLEGSNDTTIEQG